MSEAIELTKRGVTVDIDTVEQDAAKWVRFFFDNGGDPERLTISSDASITSPRTLFDQIRSCIHVGGYALERVLPFVTSNTARVLKLDRKGKIEAGADADLLVLNCKSLEILEVIARGKRMVRGGRVAVEEKFLEDSNRKINLRGSKA